MDVGPAGPQDVGDLARLLWLNASPDEQQRQSTESFATDLDTWWTGHARSHVAFVARSHGTGAVGMAWLALVPRPPRPGAGERLSADVQSVYVLPDHRGKGLGAALVRAATEHALRLGVARVTVHSSERAVPLYERLGFATSRTLLQTPADS